MTRPNFLVIGAMKAGTTSLHRYLDDHPQVFASATKELHFFVEELGWTKGWAWYEEQFAGAAGALAVGESSPGYAAYPYRRGVPARVAEGLPEVKLVYLLRHPVDRARSEYVHRWLLGHERRPIDVALRDDPRYLWKSSYALQIEQYLERFPRDRLLLVLSEDLRDRRAATMRRIYEFLGVDPEWTGRVVEHEFHRRAGTIPATRLATTVRRLPGYAAVARRSPRPLAELYRARARRTAERRSTVPDALRRHLEERLADDLDRLRAMVPGAVERWGLG